MLTSYIFLCGLLVVVISALVIAIWKFRAPKESQSKQPVGQQLTDEEKAVVARYNDLYREVPLWGGQEWKTLGIDDLVSIHRGASQLLAVYHGVTSRAIVQQMIDRAEGLAEWMHTNQHRRFYEESDMRAFINGPRAVAEALKKE